MSEDDIPVSNRNAKLYLLKRPLTSTCYTQTDETNSTHHEALLM